jgi:hypothetical protein
MGRSGAVDRREAEASVTEASLTRSSLTGVFSELRLSRMDPAGTQAARCELEGAGRPLVENCGNGAESELQVAHIAQ